MSVNAFFMPSNNLIGAGSLAEAARQTGALGFRKALIVTDQPLVKIGFAERLSSLLKEHGVDSVVFSGVKPNPDVANVEDGLRMLRESGADCVVSLGGGSPHDCAKGIALVATNGGAIADYEGLDQSAKPQLPMIAINTTAGTASEMTRFTIITDTARHVKMAIVDKHVTPILSVNDPELMAGMPADLTAATGMDALTHAIEAYVSTASTPITDANAVQAVALIARHLPTAVTEPGNALAREQMAYAQFLAGMAFNNASLGYVHAMAHQLGGFYDLPHGVCNAVLLPHVQRFNQRAAKERLDEIGRILGANNAELAGVDPIEAISKLARRVGIPARLRELGVKEEDFEVLARNAMKDVCGATNPVQPTLEEVIGIFRAAF